MTSFDVSPQDEQLRVVNAFLDAEQTILISLSQLLTLPYDPAQIKVVDVSADRIYSPVTVENALTPPSSQTNLLRITLAAPPDVSHQLQIYLGGARPQVVIPRKVLDAPAYRYDGDDLGVIYSSRASSFRLWAPTASAVYLLLYTSEEGPQTQQITMQRAERGTWFAQVEGDLAGWFYLYEPVVQGVMRTAVDPYARAIAPNATRAMIVDLQQTNPPAWEHDQPIQLATAVDAIIYETHVRDYSIAPNSGLQHKGQYLAFTEAATTGPANVTTGLAHLQQLGITHVQVLPIASFASIDELRHDQYNWGYDPRNYNVPEGAYATTPYGTARVSELKQMILALHRAGLGLVMDVVYNHTFVARGSDFDKIVPSYYYRTDDFGNYTNGSGVGNELATERLMVQKFVRDSLTYWAREYHVDGFRFDLMALLGVDTMRLVAQDLHALNPYMLVYGEPWAGGNSALPGDQLLTKGQQRGLGIGVFNDHLRSGVIGSVFDHSARGFVTGATDQWGVRQGVMGSVHDFASEPAEALNYVTSHDNLTLWDKIAASAHDASEQERIQMQKLALAIVMTAQGMAFLAGGDEFLRTKHGNDNSYNAGDAINQFDWERKAQYLDAYNYISDLIHLRRNHPAFRLTSAAQIEQHLEFLSGPDNTIAFLLKEHANGDAWRNIVVVYNPNRFSVTFALPPGSWTFVSDQQRIDEHGLGQISDIVGIESISCRILYQD
jgi:pullulanase